MRWENLTCAQFTEAVQSTKRVCLLPFGIVEKHGNHLPMGTDMMIARAVADKAAEIEPVIVFPDYYFGQVSEVRHWPGTIALSGETQLRLLKEVCQEIRRNGFDKIILVNGHGGNAHLLRYFVQTTLDERKDYAVYSFDIIGMSPEQLRFVAKHCDAPEAEGHGGHMETSLIMQISPSLVYPDRMTPGEGEPKGRGGWLAGENMFSSNISAAIHWYSDFPDHISGDPSRAKAEYGKVYLDFCADNLVSVIRKIKADETTLQLQKEFFDRSDEVAKIDSK